MGRKEERHSLGRNRIGRSSPTIALQYEVNDHAYALEAEAGNIRSAVWRSSIFGKLPAIKKVYF